MNVIETLFGPSLFGQMFTKTNQVTNPWAGLTVIQSGSASVTVSTNAITSGSIIRYGCTVGSVGVSAASGGAIVVNSIVDGTSFAFARQYGVANAFDDTVMWEIVATKEG